MVDSSKALSRSPSLASSAPAEDQEKLAMEMNVLPVSSSRNSTDAELGKEGEEEQDGLLRADGKPAEPPKENFRAAVMWMVINTLATIGIVSLHPHGPLTEAAPAR